MYVTLFASRNGYLDHSLQATVEDIEQRLRKWKADALLNASEHDVIETLIGLGTVACPVLLREEIYTLEMTEEERQYVEFGDRITRRVTVMTFVVPYEGEEYVFRVRPTATTLNPPRVAELNSRDLRIVLDIGAMETEQLRRQFHEQLDSIDMYLAWARTDIDRHNQRIRSLVPQLVAQRKAELLAQRNLQAELGFPIRRRADAGTYSVPVKRREIRPTEHSGSRAGSKPFTPEPAMADADYEAALQALGHQRNALERSPAVAVGMDEEAIRNLLLVNLNAQFEGAATGETFNASGKTDILVRVQDRNIFIGECKFWNGPQSASDALDQLLGYLTWRDTKAALLLFIKNKDVSAAVKSAAVTIDAHPNTKRRGHQNTDERIDFVLHANGDSNREIRLALLPFALPADATSRFKRKTQSQDADN
ncbi:hypothetical protein [Actinomadura rayongensis]|uniref:Uncharacterized protein n=1 Tax=Actinomadura rayongensis TaxID=1429076 RepID=A0A6I4WCB8_9ACTN|nr:hypothetical protein [Actinomadura rayongensis]MXQ65586.1 hypothetical protein [Actinomadura rayongensis]